MTQSDIKESSGLGGSQDEASADTLIRQLTQMRVPVLGYFSNFGRIRRDACCSGKHEVH